MKNESIIGLIAKNMFRHPNFWSFSNFKNRLHVIALMFVPVSCNDEKLKRNYHLAKYNFWSACGDSGDYEYLKSARRKLKECNKKAR